MPKCRSFHDVLVSCKASREHGKRNVRKVLLLSAMVIGSGLSGCADEPRELNYDWKGESIGTCHAEVFSDLSDGYWYVQAQPGAKVTLSWRYRFDTVERFDDLYEDRKPVAEMNYRGARTAEDLAQAMNHPDVKLCELYPLRVQAADVASEPAGNSERDGVLNPH